VYEHARADRKEFASAKKWLKSCGKNGSRGGDEGAMTDGNEKSQQTFRLLAFFF